MDELENAREAAQNDKWINDALDKIGIPRKKGFAELSTFGRVSLVLDDYAALAQAARDAERVLRRAKDNDAGIRELIDAADKLAAQLVKHGTASQT